MALFEYEQEFAPPEKPEKPLTFKDAARADIDEVFFNLDEHADLHTFDGKEMPAIIDRNALLERKAHWEGGAKQSFDSGLYQADMMVYVKAKDYGPRPKIGKNFTLDGRRYEIYDCQAEEGVYALTVRRVRQ